MTGLEIVVAGEPMVLLPERAAYLPAHDALIVADLHWGKAATFRAAGIPIPTGTTAADLERLTAALQVTGARHLIVLGDLLHARAGRQPGTLSTIAEWRARHARVTMRLVRGNHDAHAGDPPSSLDVECVDAPFVVGAFACAHHPAPHAEGYTLAGHLHPNVALGGRGIERLRLPCFVVGPRIAVLPAFAEFTGRVAYRVQDDESVFAIADGSVIAVR
jgi:DNA ligase-associated metallophosphoesterase